MEIGGQRMRNRAWLVGAATIVIALGLSACGKRGALQPPPGTAAVEPAAKEKGKQTSKTAEKPHKPFILDGLL